MTDKNSEAFKKFQSTRDKALHEYAAVIDEAFGEYSDASPAKLEAFLEKRNKALANYEKIRETAYAEFKANS